MWPLYLMISILALAYSAWGISNGKIWAKGGRYNRAKEPKLFWTCVSIYLVIAFCFGVGAIKHFSN